jgi:A-factor biosynthesis hotdog domain
MGTISVDTSTESPTHDVYEDNVTVTNEHIHVLSDTNAFVKKVRRISPGVFESELLVDGTHPYLYENPILADHVSGTNFLDFSRQLLKAISHLFYGAPVSNRFVLRKVQLDLTRWAKMRVPVRAVVTAAHECKTVFGHECIFIAATMSLYQEGWGLGSMSGEFTTFPLEVEQRLMKRQYNQDPRMEHKQYFMPRSV